MKKFLIFLVAIIVTVCIGMVFYQFAKNDEVVKVEAATVYVNYGEKLSLNDIGFSRIDASKDTKFNFNAGGEETTSIIKYDEVSKCYIPTQKGGATTIKITTSLRKYKTFSIDVVVGIGTEEHPYYISSQEQLNKIGTDFELDACYALVNDIELKGIHTPIGLVNGLYYEFLGKFNGNYKTISNMVVDSCDYAGLFAILGAPSVVYNLNVENATMVGSYINVGSIAGTCYGNINKVSVVNSNIANDKANSNTGAIVGLLAKDPVVGGSVSLLRSTAYTDNNSIIKSAGTLGGLVGKANSAVIQACYSGVCLQNTDFGFTGGLVGELEVDPNTYIRECYTISQIKGKSIGNIAGKISLASNSNIKDINKQLVLVGLYYNSDICSAKSASSDDLGFTTASGFGVSGKTTADMKKKSTYIYYINSKNEPVYWDAVWRLVDGEYPSLIFAGKFDDVVIGDGNTSVGNPTIPDNPDIENPDIENPDQPNLNAVILSSKQDVLDHWQHMTQVSGDYILANNIDLGGMTWTPINFQGSIRPQGIHRVTISNFKINSSRYHIGFFASLTSANIYNIGLSDVTIIENGINDTAGILVGYINGNTTINNVIIKNSSISANTKYAGGLAGYVGSAVAEIKGIQILNTSIAGKALNAGGVVGRSGENTTLSGLVVDKKCSVTAFDRAGGIAAINHGVINGADCCATVSSSATASQAGYFGGLTGVNHSTVNRSQFNSDVKVCNLASVDQNIYYFAGGLCGYNLGTINECNAFSSEISATGSSSIAYLGGLTAYNMGSVLSCFGNIDTIGSVENKIYSAGLSAYNFGGKISACMVFTDLNGYIVAGLAYVNSNNGTIEESVVGASAMTRATFKGERVSGLVYSANSGTINNSIVMAKLNCTSEDGWLAGIATFMACNDNKFATISHCIADVSFNGVGHKYLELAQDGLMGKNRTTGTITSCVISSDAKVDGVLISKPDKILFWEQDVASKSNYVIKNTNEMKDINTYLDSACNFDISSSESKTTKWLARKNCLPIPREAYNIFDRFGG